MHVRQVSKKKKKSQKQKTKTKQTKKNPKKKKKLNTWDFCFAAMLDIHKVMDIKQFIFTASLLVHLFLGYLKHLNTNKRSVAKIMKANSR